MEQKGHIAKVDEPTDWMSSAVNVKMRNGQPRVCLDPRELNKHIKIPKLSLPTIDDVTSRLAKVQVFTVLDAKDGPFGICSAPEEFLETCQRNH